MPGSGQLASAQARAAVGAPAGSAHHLHPPLAQQALRRPEGKQALPHVTHTLGERKPAAIGAWAAFATSAKIVHGSAPGEVLVKAGLPRRPRGTSVTHGAHETLRQTPTTRPMTFTSELSIGLRASFSGCSLMWSRSLKKRLTVASLSPTSATTISPSRAVC